MARAATPCMYYRALPADTAGLLASACSSKAAGLVRLACETNSDKLLEGRYLCSAAVVLLR